MLLRELTHPPPSRPAVVDESVKDMELVCHLLKTDQVNMNGMKDKFGTAGPVRERWISHERLRLLEQERAHGLERRCAVYDSHGVDRFIKPERGHLRYFRGDTIEVLRRCNNVWAVGLSGGNVGLFPLEHTGSNNFSVVFTSYTALNAEEVSVQRGQVVPTFTSTVARKCQVYTSQEYGLVPKSNVVSLRPPPVQDRDQDDQLYYQHAPLDRGHIRLIYVTFNNAREFQASGKQSLFITLTHEPLSKTPEYAAFSYCWGDPTDTTPVFCNGKLLYVPSSLWRLLRWHMPGGNNEVYHQYDTWQEGRINSPAVFWADAICINQRDILEKNHQIPLMKSIYEKASCVVAYAGETDSGLSTIVSMDLLTNAIERNIPSMVTSLAETHDLSGRVDWHAIKGFFSQPLFRRSWVIQEIILSRKITFCYGTARIVMSRIHDCSLTLSDNNLKPPHPIPDDTHDPQAEKSEAFKEGHRQILNLSGFKTSWDNSTGTVPFINVLQRFRSAQATDPRDKVYSLLSLASERYQRAIIPDYSTSNTAVDVYEHLARCAIQFHDDRVLLHNAGISRKNATLASWAPDWSYEPRQVIPMSLFSCSGSRIHRAPHVTPYTHQNRAKLNIRGTIIDKVSRTGPRWGPDGESDLPGELVTKASGDMSVAFYLTDAFNNLIDGTMEQQGGRYHNGDTTSTATWQTLVCGMMHGENRAVLRYEVHYNAFLEYRKDAEKSNQSAMSRDEVEGVDNKVSATLEGPSLDFHLGSPDRATRQGAAARVGGSSESTTNEETMKRKSELEEEAMPFIRALIRAQTGRRTCVTERSYFAAVPDEAREGDEIAIFFGHELPYIVRRAGGPDSVGTKQFRLVGQCYVHGIMDGELLDPATGTTFPGFRSMDFSLV